MIKFLMGFLLLILVLLAPAAWAQKAPSLCDIIETANCSGVTKQSRRSSSLSLPSPSTSANTNPATVSFDRGFGVEFIHQNNNSVVFNVVTGSGKLGGALISQSLENAFFGNRVPEIENDYFERLEDDKQYKSKKLNLALGGKLTRGKFFSADAGIILKRHSEVRKINPGLGLSGRLGFLHIGAAAYYDDFFLDFKDNYDPFHLTLYRFYWGKPTYTEKFLVQSYSVGSKYKNFSFDAGVIKTHYKFYEEDSKITLYSFSYFYNAFLINVAFRNEQSPGMKYKEGELVFDDSQSSTFAGVQLSIGKRLILGVNYNYFLLEELSFTGTIFI